MICVGNFLCVYFFECNVVGELQLLIVVLYVSGFSGLLMVCVIGLIEIVEVVGYMIVYFNGIGLVIDVCIWNFGGCCGYVQMYKVDDVVFLCVLIDKLVKDGLVDLQCIYLVGVFNGGMMVYCMVVEVFELFKVVVVVSVVLDVLFEIVKVFMLLLYIYGSDDFFIFFLGGIGKQEVLQLLCILVVCSIEVFIKVDGVNLCLMVIDIFDIVNDGIIICQYIYVSKSDLQVVVFYEVKGGGYVWLGGVVFIVNGGKFL